jgi:flavin-dependent dehydrogenase
MWRTGAGATLARMTYDVIVIGARCAGASTSLLLSQVGLRVLLIDRADFPSDTVSGHAIKQPGVERLHRWGVLDAVLASGCPVPSGRTIDFGVRRLHVPTEPGALSPIVPRRTVLDAILIAAAASAGTEVRLRTSLVDVLVDGDAVTGVRLRDRSGRTWSERADLVIGADGRRSRLAHLVRAAAYHVRPTVSLAYYAYWEGVASSAVVLYPRAGALAGMGPTHHDQTMVFVQLPIARRAEFVRDVNTNYLTALRCIPEVAVDLENARLASRVVGMTDLPNFFRVPFGPGWALVGDAGHHKDPLVARGISDAFRDAELLAEAIVTHHGGATPLAPALRRYQRIRDAASSDVADLNVRLAALDAPLDEVVQMFQELAAREQDADRATATAIRQ